MKMPTDVASPKEKRHSLHRTARLRSQQIAGKGEKNQVELGTSGPVIVHCVEQRGDLLKLQKEWQAKGKIAWAMELEGHGSAKLADIQEWLPHIA